MIVKLEDVAWKTRLLSQQDTKTLSAPLIFLPRFRNKNRSIMSEKAENWDFLTAVDCLILHSIAENFSAQVPKTWL